jgi:hypothetical protein
MISYDCPEQTLDKAGKQVRIIVATHPAGTAKSRIGVTRSGVVYELFLTNLPQSAFTAADIVALYLHRGAYACNSFVTNAWTYRTKYF